MTQLPAHLQNRQQSLVGRAADGMGGLLPPHISIKDNRFTFVDAAANRRIHEQITLDVIIADLSDHMCKRFYKYDYEPGADDPPTCWSANGVGPSVDAIEPQAPTCAACPNNVRGSATSNISGKSIKACRDERFLAVVASPFPDMRWQMVLTPGSFKNWAAYTKVLADRGVDLPWVVTRLGFERQGVLSFSLLENGWTPPPLLEQIERERGSHAYDALVGRNDRPRQGALPAPIGTVQRLPDGTSLRIDPSADGPQQSFQPNPPPAAGFGAAPSAGSQSTSTGFAGAPTQAQASPATATAAASPSEPQRRKRRTRAEMEAARQGQAPPAGPAQAPFPTGEPAQAAFGGAPSAGAAFGAAPPAPNGGFGIQAGQEPGAELKQMLDNTFGKA